jgi:DNA polymerase-3 subunit delta
MAKEGFTYENLLGKLNKREFFPVYLFHGEEDFIADEACDAVIEAALTREERGFNLDVLHGHDADVRDIVARASAFPMMAGRRVVVVRDMEKLSGKELLAGYVEDPSPSTCLVMISSKPDLRKKPYVAVKKVGFVLECKPLYDNQIPDWISRRVKQQKHDIDDETSKMLAAYAGSSLREVQNELDKVYTFIGERMTITTDDISAVVGLSKEYNVFELQRAVGTRDIRKSSEILFRMLDVGESAIGMVVMLTRYFTNLWKLHDMRRRKLAPKEQAAALGINPFFMREYEAATGKYSSAEIENAFEILAEADLQLKSSRDDRLVMQSCLVRLVSAAS